ncbi:MAG: hypothetical protein AAF456_01450 [Planctomycetota bacterium]
MNKRTSEKLLAVLFVATLVFPLGVLSGCSGNEDPRTIQISGTVTLNGEPIRNGKISFSPDTQQGNSGPMGVARIKDGKFDTTDIGGRGVVGGPHRVEIENLLPSPGDGEEEIIEGAPAPSQNPIEGGHFEDWDIPTDAANPITKNFEIDA